MPQESFETSHILFSCTNITCIRSLQDTLREDKQQQLDFVRIFACDVLLLLVQQHYE